MTQYSDPANEVTNHATDIRGFNPTLRHTWPKYGRIGTVTKGKQGTEWVYVKAGEAVATGTCTVNTSTFLLTDTAGNHTADAAFADGEYGWVRQTAVDLS